MQDWVFLKFFMVLVVFFVVSNYLLACIMMVFSSPRRILRMYLFRNLTIFIANNFFVRVKERRARSAHTESAKGRVCYKLNLAVDWFFQLKFLNTVITAADWLVCKLEKVNAKKWAFAKANRATSAVCLTWHLIQKTVLKTSSMTTHNLPNKPTETNRKAVC